MDPKLLVITLEKTPVETEKSFLYFSTPAPWQPAFPSLRWPRRKGVSLCKEFSGAWPMVGLGRRQVGRLHPPTPDSENSLVFKDFGAKCELNGLMKSLTYNPGVSPSVNWLAA